MRKFSGYIAILSIVLISCKKEGLPVLPDSNNPIYTLIGELDGEAFNIEVGVGDAVIEYGKDEMNGIQTFYGQIASESKDFCLRLDLLRPELLPAEQEIEGLMPSEPGIFVHSPGCVMMDFGASSIQVNNLLVENQDGEFQSLNSASFDEFGMQTVAMKFTDVNDKIYEITIPYGFEPIELDPKFDSYGSGDTCFLVSNNTYATSAWYVDEDLVSTDANCEVVMSNGIHNVRHVVTDLNGNTAEHATFIRFRTGSYFWQLKYNYCTPPANNFHKMLISFKKGTTWYHSSNVLLNAPKTVKMDNINFLRDQMNELILSYFNLAFSAELEDDENQSSIYLENVAGRTAVGLE